MVKEEKPIKEKLAFPAKKKGLTVFERKSKKRQGW